MASKCSLYFSLHCNIDEVKWSEVVQSCLTLCDPMDCSLPGVSGHGIFQARVLEWGAISFSRGSSRPWDQTRVSRIVGRRFTFWATRDAFGKLEESEAECGCGSQHPQSQGPLIPSSAQRVQVPCPCSTLENHCSFSWGHMSLFHVFLCVHCFDLLTGHGFLLLC